MALSKGRIVGLGVIGVIVVVLAVLLLTGGDDGASEMAPDRIERIVERYERDLNKMEQDLVVLRRDYPEDEEYFARAEQEIGRARELLPTLRGKTREGDVQAVRAQIRRHTEEAERLMGD